MGNNASGNIRVQTSKQLYMAGEEVQGNVYVYLTAPVKTKGIFLRLRGVERVMFEENKTREVAGRGEGAPKTTETYTVTHRDEHTFVNVKVPVMQPPPRSGAVEPGQYQIPFSLTLPANAPGTFHKETGMTPNRYECSLGYEVDAFVSVSGMFKSDMTHSQAITVSARPLDPSANGPETVEKREQVCFCCCIPRGELYLRAHLSKSYYVPGEMAYAIVEASNGSRSKVAALSVRFERTLRLKTRNGGHRLFKTDVIARNDHQGLEPREACLGDRCRSMPLSLTSMRGDLPSLQPEVLNSTLIDCRYQIEVLAKIDWAPDVGVILPIHLLAQPMPGPYLTAEPNVYMGPGQQPPMVMPPMMQQPQQPVGYPMMQQPQQPLGYPMPPAPQGQVMIPEAQQVVWEPVMLDPVQQAQIMLVDPSAPSAPENDLPPAYTEYDTGVPNKV